jgi:methyl-accepting chemotaxis protein
MHGRNRASVRWRLVLVTVVTSIVAQLLASAILAYYDNAGYETQRIRVAVIEAKTLAESLAASLVFHDTKATQEYLNPLATNPDIIIASVYAKNGALIASYATPEARPRLPQTAPTPGQHFEGDELLVTVPVAQNHEPLGTVFLSVGTEPLLKRMLRYGGIVFLALLASLALAVPVSMRLNAAISNPIREIAAGASRISAGDLGVNVPQTERADEIGVLFRTFDRMVTSLRQMTGEINSGATMLAEMADSILTTMTEVSTGSAETATAIGETSVTMEEVRQTAELSAEKARQVSEGAQRTAQATHSGRTAVEAVTDGMSRIREQVEAVAASILRLSDRGQAIGEIIAAVSDLADQSNLLAVNAAIEAARAGEQGRGFSVVAQEVKNLADQSKQATAQVRSILGEIQKATTAAVLATEQCSKAVDVGVKESALAGESIRILAENIENATHAAMQIAASSQQQLAGVSQVALAMENIKQASVQNAASVKHTESAAQSMSELSQKLGSLAKTYRS